MRYLMLFDAFCICTLCGCNLAETVGKGAMHVAIWAISPTNGDAPIAKIAEVVNWWVPGSVGAAAAVTAMGGFLGAKKVLKKK